MSDKNIYESQCRLLQDVYVIDRKLKADVVLGFAEKSPKFAAVGKNTIMKIK